LNIILTHKDNFDVIEKLHFQKCKIIVLGEKDRQWYKIKNVSFMSLHHFLKTYKTKKIHSILILDKINYLDPESINIFKNQKTGIFSGSNIKGDDELYLAQVMGNLPFHLTSYWHDNYIDKNYLSKTSLADDFIETFLFQYRKNPDKFDFKKYRTTKPSQVVYTKNNIYKYIRSFKFNTVQDLLSHFKEKYILSECWYLVDENKNIISRLHKH
jgi:hypothetical protein